MKNPLILIIRTSAMGDVVMASVLAEGIRQKYPDAHICWLAEPQVISLIEANPFIDEVISFPKSEWKRLVKTGQYLMFWRAAALFIKNLRAKQFDIVFDVQGLLRTRLLAWLSAAKNITGFSTGEAGRLFLTEILEPVNSKLIGNEYYELLRLIGVDTKHICQRVYLSNESSAEALAVCKKELIDKPYIVFAPFTTRPQKHWFDDRWVLLAKELLSKTELQIVWMGGASNAKDVDVLSAKGGGIALAGKTELAVSAAIISTATALVGVDTGLTHLGTAFNLPTISLFGSTCPYLETKTSKTVVIYHSRSCSPCRRSPSCDGRFDCMADITVNEVLQSLSKLGIAVRNQ